MVRAPDLWVGAPGATSPPLCAVRAEQREDLAGADVEVHPSQRLEGAVALLETSDLYDGFHEPPNLPQRRPRAGSQFL